MSFTGESPGSIKNQIGRGLIAMQECVERKDLTGFIYHTRFLITRARPLVGEAERKRLVLPEIDPPKSRAEAWALFEKMNIIVEDLLTILAGRGIYAWTAPEEGDASAFALKGEKAEDPEADAGVVSE